MMFLGNPKPKSSAKLQQRIQRAMDGLPPVRQKILHQNIHNTILLQFLEGLGVAKGGGALSLRMPLPKGRVSRDFDSASIRIAGGREAAQAGAIPRTERTAPARRRYFQKKKMNPAERPSSCSDKGFDPR